MPKQDMQKFYPAASDQIATLLGMGAETASGTPPTNNTISVPTNSALPIDTTATVGQEPSLERSVPDTITTAEISEVTQEPKTASGAIRVLIGLLPYLAVFVVGVVVYYVFFSGSTTGTQLLKSVQKKQPTEAELKVKSFEQLKAGESANYLAWINGFYFRISDDSILGMDRVAPNRLTNFENYLLRLNPKTNDVRRTGITDAESVLNGIDPYTGLPLTDAQKDVVAQVFDQAAIRARISGQAVGPEVNLRGLEIARAQAQGIDTAHYFAESPVPVAQPAPVATSQPTPTPVAQTPAPATPKPVTQKPATPAPATAAPAVGMGTCNVNTNIPGRIEIPSIGVNVPIIWTTDPKNFDNDLKTGVVHYPGTPIPCDVGRAYISGHSSNYSWIKANYNQVFAKLNQLKPGATFKITVVDMNGKDIRLHYVVTSQKEFAADDQAQFANTAVSEVALSTCWPLNTTKRRLVAFARLDRIEK